MEKYRNRYDDYKYFVAYGCEGLWEVIKEFFCRSKVIFDKDLVLYERDLSRFREKFRIQAERFTSYLRIF